MYFILVITGELDQILRTLLDTAKDDVSREATLELFRKIETDASEICHAKYGLSEAIRFSTTGYTVFTTRLGKQSFKSLDCIRLSIKKNLLLMNENAKSAFQLYLSKCD